VACFAVFVPVGSNTVPLGPTSTAGPAECEPLSTDGASDTVMTVGPPSAPAGTEIDDPASPPETTPVTESDPPSGPMARP